MSIQNPLDDVMDFFESVYNTLIEYWWITITAAVLILIVIAVMILGVDIPFL